ncbi:hypothetical protein F0562_003077 [Nyssa sinensis]|uniref:Uncharacterized protein n=1 Tax=Nyssa sinensis TaxID=561372 RepID=A0A5J5BYI2_9ASTE|nr:hypothetical protein F0562_003077 [Nyssa sinensis]
MAWLWSHDPIFRPRQAHCSKGSSSFLCINPKKHPSLAKTPPKFSSSDQFCGASFAPAIDNLPENTEATTDIPSDKVRYLKKAFDYLQIELTRSWKTQLQIGLFTTLPLMGYPQLRVEDLTNPPKWVPFPSNLAHRLYEIKWIVEGAQNITCDVLATCRLESAIIVCDAFLTRDCREFEHDWLKLLQELHQRPVVPVGLMPPTVPVSRDETNDTWMSISGWPEEQNKGSVVYVGLGSEVELSQEALTELALGLELSGCPSYGP